MFDVDLESVAASEQKTPPRLLKNETQIQSENKAAAKNGKHGGCYRRAGLENGIAKVGAGGDEAHKREVQDTLEKKKQSNFVEIRQLLEGRKYCR